MQKPLGWSLERIKLYMYMIILVGLLFAGLTAYFAKVRGRNPITWFFIGIMLGVLGLLLVLLLPAQTKQGEGRQREVAPANLSEVHSEAASPIDNARNLPPIKRIPTSSSIQWYYVDENQNITGPLKIDALRKEFALKKADITTYIWCEEFEDWTQLLEFQNANVLTDPDLIE